jgi:hypothetical protein
MHFDLIIITAIFFFLNIQDNRKFERIIAQEDISINNVSLLQNNQTESSIHDKNIIVILMIITNNQKINVYSSVDSEKF